MRPSKPRFCVGRSPQTYDDVIAEKGLRHVLAVVVIRPLVLEGCSRVDGRKFKKIVYLRKYVVFFPRRVVYSSLPVCGSLRACIEGGARDSEKTDREQNKSEKTCQGGKE